MNQFDIAIVGGGLAGTAAAIVAARTGASVIHFAPKGPIDKRTSALMTPSVDILRDNGLVANPDDIAVPLTEIRIIDATSRLVRAPETLFRATETGQAQFGWNFPNAVLLDHLEAEKTKLKNLVTCADLASGFQRKDKDIEVATHDGAVYTVALLVGADGKTSNVRKWAGLSTRQHVFAQSALVTDLELERPIGGASIEFHYENGPFTLVPAGGSKANLVWIDKAPELARVRDMAQAERDAFFAAKSQHLFGKVKSLFAPVIFPLSTLSVSRAASANVLVLGEAAHAFPPIGAQGLNLGLRDVADFGFALDDTDRTSADWAASVATAYADRRRSDLLQTGTFVDALFGSLLSGFLPVQAGRAAGLWALKLVPPLRKKAMALGMGNR